MSARYFEICYMLTNTSNNAQQRTVIQATDSCTARRIFEQQNHAARVCGTPQEVTGQVRAGTYRG